MKPLIIAHRTCPKDAPENSLAGLAAAKRLGADAVEIDLRVSLDQRPFLMHDWTMRRTTGLALPIELTLSSTVRKQRLELSEEPVPSLAQTFDALDPEMMVAVDVKTPWSIFHLAREANRRGVQQRVMAWCTSALDVRYMRFAAPLVETAYLRNDRDAAGKLSFLAQARRLNANAISAHWDAIDERFVSNAHDLGLRVYSWHGEAELTDEKLRAGLDGLITDYPVMVREAIERVVTGNE